MQPDLVEGMLAEDLLSDPMIPKPTGISRMVTFIEREE
jgi:hypothetical protein